jgi:hypothetical protein
MTPTPDPLRETAKNKLVRRPMTVPEHEFLIGDGSLAGALAGAALRYVYCDCRRSFVAAKWREHMRALGHEAWAFERTPDYVSDCIVVIDGPAVWPEELR